MTVPLLSGVFAAAVTPFTPDGEPDLDGLLALLDFLACRGCAGALLMGTTGEGPSLSARERLEIIKVGVRIRYDHPGFRLLAGVGTPSQDETAELARRAFDWGCDGVVVLPPYYYRNADDDGLYAWYAGILDKAVPEGGSFLGYHFPGVSGVGLSLDLLDRLRTAYPGRFVGIKDSSASAEHAAALGARFGTDLHVFNGTDRLFTQALEAGAAGCITAMANLVSPDLRLVWQAFRNGKRDPAAQQRLDQARDVSERFSPAAALIKLLLAAFHDFPHWPVKPPLRGFDERTSARARLAWQGRGKIV